MCPALGERQRFQARDRPDLLLADVVVEATAVLADGAEQAQHQQHGAVVEIVVIPVVGAGTVHDHDLATAADARGADLVGDFRDDGCADPGVGRCLGRRVVGVQACRETVEDRFHSYLPAAVEIDDMAAVEIRG